jgi:membrane protease YdiL (CAAX protease family)
VRHAIGQPSWRAQAGWRDNLLDTLPEASVAYVPRTGWPAWAVIPAGAVIFVLAALLGMVLGLVYAAHVGALNAQQPPREFLVAWLGGLQIGLVLLTWAAAGFFASQRSEVLALRPPRGGWRVLPLALLPVLAFSALWTGFLLWWNPAAVIGDLRPVQELLHGGGTWAVLAIIGVGAPFSEEFLFRGFLFSGLAKSRLGLVGTGLVTTFLWTLLHYGYSIFGLLEVFAIGLYFSWLLARTGSLWVTIFCHAAYNTIIAVALYFVSLPAPA